ncbi:Carbohydrate binding domain-containing protein [Andreprevotia lacus DSM 23236]|jgi:hypothetical protein|uniref:Carbohydrate binding domain-containing protein n=1 Tax=Andreprevotia lacus DSM 23236 TaxID=1121001 RepID=A0A1W1XXR6_9NEIS|nr:M64 family metallopeptidase [Andreprevotia lacus]SMC28644.1 Carbohydrate binding domain-containing protein [Andreprevotia lacus DSM 23236]
MNKPLLLPLLFAAAMAQAATPTLVEYQVNGPRDKRVNILFLAEGYVAGQEAQFQADMAKFNTALMDAPWSSYTRYFNTYGVFVASNAQGASKEDGSTVKDTYFNCSYYTSNIDRLLACNTSKTTAIKNQYLPEADIVMVIVNSSKYGGSGGSIAVANRLDPEIVAHEVGHSFAKLADEYEYAGGTPHEAPNATAIISPRTSLKWNYWVDGSTPIATPETSTYGSVVGAFEGAVYSASGWWRPTQNSRMRNNGIPLGPVNSEQFVLAMYDHVSPLDGYSPAAGTVAWQGPGTLSVAPKQPDGFDLAVEWWVNGVKTAETGKSFNGSNLPLTGSATVMAKVIDRGSWVRQDPKGLLDDSVSWTVTRSATPTPTPTMAPTSTPVPTATPKPTVVPTSTPVPTATPRPTVAPTSTPVPTATPKPTVAPTSTPVPTATPKPTVAPTSTPVPTATPKPTVAPTSTPVPTATPKPTAVPTVTPTPVAACPAAWDAGAIYVGGNQVSYQGKRYQAKWWTRGDNPSLSGQWDVWQNLGNCP